MKRGLIAAIAIVVSLTGCFKEENIELESESRRLVLCTFTTGVSGESKTTLTAEGIETRISDLMIAVYRSGKLFSHQYWSSAPGSIELLLQEKVAFAIYTWANMGDFSANLPFNESGMADLSYTVPSYESVNQKGFPMSKVIRFRPGLSATDNTILLERLFAKVTVNLECKWPGGQIVGARLGNLNRKLKPFEDSAITNPSNDVFEGTPESDTAGGTSATLVLYVPENRQGTIDEITSPEDKSQDKTAEVNAIKERLTYLEVEVSGNDLYQGSMTYRNYLGDNATDSFDIRRNTSYTWNIEYYEDNLYKDEWKYDNELTDTRYLSTVTHIYVTPGQTVSLGNYLDSNMEPETLRWEPLPQSNLGDILQNTLNKNNLSLPSFTVRLSAPAGSSFNALIAPQNNSQDNLRKEISVNVRNPLNLEMSLIGGSAAYPYQTARFKSASVLTSDQALHLSETLNLDVSPDNVIEGLQGWDYNFDYEGYYLLFNMVPTMPGNYHCATVNSTDIDWIDFTVEEPQICLSRERIYLDTAGYDSPVTLTLCNADGEILRDGFYYPECSVEFNVEPQYRPDVYIGLNSDGGAGYSTTVKNYSVIFRGNKNMAGTVIPATARYTYPNGYSVSKTISIQIVPS